MKKLAIITTHPIQYYAPLFRKIAERGTVQLKVFYTWSQAKEKVYDPGFGKERSWDIPLLEGYDYTFVENTSKSPGSHHFNGIINPSLIKKVQKWESDAIIVFGWSFRSHLAVMRFFKGKVPVMFKGDSNLLDEPKGFSVKKMARRIFLSWVYSHIDVALYVGSANKAYYLAHGVPAEKLVFSPHAIDNERFKSNGGFFETKAAEWRKELGIKEGETVFVYAAKLISKKQPEFLITSFLSLQLPQARLVIIGNGEMEGSLKEKYGNNKAIIFADFQNQSNMPVVYRLGDVFCLPSKGPGETWGLAVNEAMACARPVLVSDKAGCAIDLVKEGENGYVFNSGNTSDLCTKMKLLMSRKEELKQMGSASLTIVEDWSYENIIQSIEKITSVNVGK
ncbi:MAG: glycosyl transferase group 1 [Segetibacter sp.]|nr:glycosyl transferase group 1 [Segetibacter sp.]